MHYLSKYDFLKISRTGTLRVRGRSSEGHLPAAGARRWCIDLAESNVVSDFWQCASIAGQMSSSCTRAMRPVGRVMADSSESGMHREIHTTMDGEGWQTTLLAGAFKEERLHGVHPIFQDP